MEQISALRCFIVSFITLWPLHCAESCFKRLKAAGKINQELKDKLRGFIIQSFMFYTFFSSEPQKHF